MNCTEIQVFTKKDYSWVIVTKFALVEEHGFAFEKC